MQIIDTPEYQKAFIQYLRRGTQIDIVASGVGKNSTLHYIWRTSGDGKVRSSHAANNGKIFA